MATAAFKSHSAIKHCAWSVSPVTSDEVAAWIRNVPPQEIQNQADFQTGGKFDMTKYQRWLSAHEEAA